MRKFKRLTLTLALLLTAVGGAWAEETPLLTIESKDYTSFTSGSKTFDDKVTVTFSNPVYYDGEEGWWYAGGDPSLLTVAGTNGYTITSCKFYTGYGYAQTGYPVEGESPSVYLYGGYVFNDASQSVTIGYEGVTKIEVYGSKSEPTEWSLTPDETGKKWTLAEMPASDVMLQVEYFAESNIFLGKEALADAANIAVKAGDLGVQFGEDGKSANTVTEGSAMTVTYNGTKKLLGVKVEKKGAGPLAAAFKDGAKFKVGYQWNNGFTTYLEFTNSGGTYSLTSVSGLNESNGFNSSTLTVKNGNVLALDVVCQPNGDRMDEFSAQIEFDATSSTYKYSSKGEKFIGIISVSVNDTDITSQLTTEN